MITIATHGGHFHADDVLATAVAKLWVELCHPGHDVRTVRTRDPKEWEKADIILDVGGRLELIEREGRVPQYWLDHHQKGGAGARQNGVPYAAAGLSWLYLGHDILLKLLPEGTGYGDRMDAHAALDRKLFQGVDAADNGFDVATPKPGLEDVRPCTLSHVLSAYNPLWDEPHVDPDLAFGRVMHGVTTHLLQRNLKAAVLFQKACDLVAKAVGEQTLAEVLVLPRFCPWQEALERCPGQDRVLYVVYPQPAEAKETWMCQAVPVSPGSFDMRKPLPGDWAGLRNRAETADGRPTVEEVSGVADAVFCHPGRFICGSRSREGAVAMALKAVRA